MKEDNTQLLIDEIDSIKEKLDNFSKTTDIIISIIALLMGCIIATIAFILVSLF